MLLMLLMMPMPLLLLLLLLCIVFAIHRLGSYSELYRVFKNVSL